MTNMKEFLVSAPMSSSTNHIAKFKSRKNLFFTFFLSILLITAALTIAALVSSTKNSSATAPSHHPVLKSSCSTTLYPDLCLSAISALPDAATKIKTTRDVIDLSLNLTRSSVLQNYLTIKKLSASPRSRFFTPREKRALVDCLDMANATLDEIDKTAKDLHDSASAHVAEVNALLSAAMTNQETCLDGLSHDHRGKTVRQLFISGQTRVFRLCSNALAMIKNLTDTKERTGESRNGPTVRKLEEGDDENEWPEWLSAGDRRLLQAGTVTPNVVVAADGSGNYRTVAEAVAAAPEGSSSRYIIRIKSGVYRENVEVPKRKTNIMFVGDGRRTTIITGNRNVVDGSTTFNSATVAIVGDGFLATEITFQNTAGPSKHQAVALRVNADLTAFYRCDMIAFQDTLYVHSLRQFYISCIIIGTVDFIFGNAAVVFQDCDIHARRPNPGQRNMVTAQGRDDPNQDTGIVIQKCRIGATQDLLPVQSSFPSYLGRPWKEYSRTVIMQTDISDVINPAGWYMWNGNFALDTLHYAEYQNTGVGADTANRVTWRGFRVITSATEAQTFTAGNFIGGGSWLPSTGFPFSLGL